MTKQTITTEIDIPDGYEFVRFGKANPSEHVLHSSGRIEEWTSRYVSKFTYIIVRPIWQPPSWMRPGWIAMDSTDENRGIRMMSGQNLRDYFAGQVLGSFTGEFTVDESHEWIAQQCYAIADAMIAQRDRAKSDCHTETAEQKIERLEPTQLEVWNEHRHDS